MLKMSDKHTPIPETKLNELYAKSKREFERNIGIQSKRKPKIF